MEENKGLSLRRNRLLIRIEKVLEGPMIFLGFVWLVLLIVEFINGFNSVLELISTIIWIIFICDFALKILLAPKKLLFLRKNILTAISLIIPALRLFRIFRFIRLLRIFRGTRLIKVIASLNRGMKSLNATMDRRGFGYVMALTIAVILAGSAGMYAFENMAFESYAVAVWWTTMLVITVGTDFWPKSAEGRILCTLLSLYGFAVFGYITATLASFFIGRDAQSKETPTAGLNDIEGLRLEVRELKKLLADLTHLKKS
ncbi:potassium channel family protein [Pedobacter sp. P351]|uniref:potassium channel family protein n=1 Tax=Pedobacter superstes TaxID=3133441 RepID=UPI0030A54251